MYYSIWAEPAKKDAKYLSQIIHMLGEKYHAPTFLPHITVYSEIKSRLVAQTAIKLH